MLKRLLSTLYESSPKALLARLRAVGHPPSTAANRVLDEILASPHFPTLLALSVSRQTKEPCILAGDPVVTGRVAEALRVRGILSEERAFSWDSSRSVLDGSAGRRIVLAQLPITAADWETVAALKRDFGANLLLLAELLLPYTRLLFLQKRLDYHVKEFDRILPFYLGEKLFGGPLDKLNALFPLDGRSIIEFGPFDGCQTAGLVHFGARPITCIEARAENATKTHTAAEIFGWDQVRVIMDDFHNADARKYGRFDLAFAHGVYYHSIAPFVFLENLRSLADNIFLGGYCATDALPTTAWSELTYEGRRFRVKEYRESDNYTSGVNETSYFMHADDLLEFFTARGHIIQTISDQTESVNAGRFLRVLITRSR